MLTDHKLIVSITKNTNLVLSNKIKLNPQLI